MNTQAYARHASSNFIEVALTTGTAKQTNDTPIWATHIWVWGYKTATHTAAPTNNAADVVSGFEDSGASPSNPKLVQTTSPGAVSQVDIPMGMARDLSELWHLGTTNDKAIVEYIVAP